MLSKSYKLFTLFGIPVGVDRTFLFLMGLIAIFSFHSLPLYFFLFVSVLIHEFGHALVGRKFFGMKCSGIVLHLLGGAAMVHLDRNKPKEEFFVALAGPVTSLALAGGLWLLLPLWPTNTLHLLVAINLIIGIFNLAPVFPMDGGRMLRAVLTRFTDNATLIAVWVGRVIITAFSAFCLAHGLYIYLLIAVFIWVFGSAELKAERQ